METKPKTSPLTLQQPEGRAHYQDRVYDNLVQWLSYWMQIESVLEFLPSKRGRVLEVGVGNATVATYLRKEGFVVQTADIDRTLEPDHIVDVRNLPRGNYDVILCCQVLEHLPFDEFDSSLRSIASALRPGGRLILSLPYSCWYFTINFSWFYASVLNPVYRRLGWEPFAPHHLQIRIPWFYLNRPSTPTHYWEVGQRGYAQRLIKTRLRQYFRLEAEKYNPVYPYHWYLVAQKPYNGGRCRTSTLAAAY